MTITPALQLALHLWNSGIRNCGYHSIDNERAAAAGRARRSAA